MCYNPSISFTFFLVGALTTAYVYFGKPELPYIGVPMILIFYTLMELLQTVQYKFVNQCDNIINKSLTEVAYLFVIVQPLLWNYFFYINSDASEKKIFEVGMTLAGVWLIINVMSRVLYTPRNRLTKEQSVFAGEKVCTKRKASHLFWEWTSANFGELNPNYLAHLMIWFIPALVSSKHRVAGSLLAVSALVGSLMTYLSGEMYIFASAWCYISVPIVLFIIYIGIIQKNRT